MNPVAQARLQHWLLTGQTAATGVDDGFGAARG